MNNTWLFLGMIIATLLCAYRTIISTRILVSAIYLACVSALVAIMLFLLGGTQVAAIELSVGAGLVTVLLVYAISVVGDDALDPKSVVPKPLAISMILSAAILLAALAIPIGVPNPHLPALSMQTVLWEHRVLDLWIQMVLIISGVMGMLGILAEGKTRPRSGLQTLVEIRGKVPLSEEYVHANQEQAVVQVEESAPITELLIQTSTDTGLRTEN